MFIAPYVNTTIETISDARFDYFQEMLLFSLYLRLLLSDLFNLLYLWFTRHQLLYVGGLIFTIRDFSIAGQNKIILK